MGYDDGDSGRDLAAQQSARTLQGAQRACTEAIYWLDTAVQQNPQRAVIERNLSPDSPMPDIHAALLLYFRQLEPHLVVRAEPHYDGSHYDEPIAVVEIPTGPSLQGFQQTRSESIDGLGDLADWAMRSVTVEGTEQSRVYLSPEAIVESYRKMLQVQAGLGLHVEARSERDQDSRKISRI